MQGPRLACLTAYWPSESQGDSLTARRQSSTGVYLRKGHCAVDPGIIPYGSIVVVDGVGRYLAVDTGSAVVSRKAARLAGKTFKQRKAVVVDIFFVSRQTAEDFIRKNPKFAAVRWWPPNSTNPRAVKIRQEFANVDWDKIRKRNQAK